MALGDQAAAGPLARAGTVLRGVPEPGWQAISGRVLDLVRATPRGGWPLHVTDPAPGTAPGVLAVSDLVLRSTLARVLLDVPDLIAVAIDVSSDAGVLQGVRVTFSGRYGADLITASERARTMCLAVMADIVGDIASATVEFAVVDVHR